MKCVLRPVQVLSLLPVDKYMLKSLPYILHYQDAFFVVFILSRKGKYQASLKDE